MTNGSPSPNGQANGGSRNARGRFTAGNPGGPGNPGAADVGRHRAAFFAALKDDDCVKALGVIRKLMGDGEARPSERLAAARELLDRVLGKAVQSDLLERIEALEAKASSGGPHHE